MYGKTDDKAGYVKGWTSFDHISVCSVLEKKNYLSMTTFQT